MTLTLHLILVRLFLFRPVLLLFVPLLVVLGMVRVLLQLLRLSRLSHLLLSQLPPPLCLSFSVILLLVRGVARHGGGGRDVRALVVLKRKKKNEKLWV